MAKQPITIQDLAKLRIVGDPQISPDGTRVIFTVKDSDLDKNKSWTHLWLHDVKKRATRQFTFGDANDTSPQWSFDGKQIIFLRSKDRRAQVWRVLADGGEAAVLTKMPEG